MNAIEKLKVAGRVAHAIELSVESTTDLPALVAAISSRLPPPNRCFVLDGRLLKPEDGALIQEPLMRGETVVLGLLSDHRFGHDLLRAWDKYAESPRHTAVSLGRGLRFEPMKEGERAGVLLLVSTVPDVAWAPGIFGVVMDEDEIRDLLDSGASEDIAVQHIGSIAVQHVGSAPVGLTIRDLCLLHLRDPRESRRRPLLDALNADDAFTWTDLKALLQQSSSTSLSLLESQFSRGRVRSDQRDFAYLAHEFMLERKEVKPRGSRAVWPSIYDVMWDLWFLEAPGTVFRGQADARWPLTPTLFRQDLDGTGPDIKTLLDRIELTRGFVDLLRQREDDLFPRPPRDDELLAVAQHYGFATPLLDYTRSLPIAALFASMGAADLTPQDASQVGVIYYMNAQQREFGVPAQGERDLANFSLLRSARIRIGDVQVIEPPLREADDRIGRQAGLFLSGFATADLKTVSIDRIFFAQVPGWVYEDETVGATRPQILPDNSPLTQLAAEVRDDYASRRRRERTWSSTLPPLLAGTLVPEHGLIGSEGAHLFRQLVDGNEFLAHLRRFATEGTSKQIAEILDHYFTLSAARARVGDVPDSADSSASSLDPLHVALENLASACHVDGRSLEQHIRDKLGNLDNPFFEDLTLEASSEGEALAFSVGLYLASWEKLQHVRGMEASTLAQNAALMLRRELIVGGDDPPSRPGSRVE